MKVILLKQEVTREKTSTGAEIKGFWASHGDSTGSYSRKDETQGNALSFVNGDFFLISATCFIILIISCDCVIFQIIISNPLR